MPIGRSMVPSARLGCSVRCSPGPLPPALRLPRRGPAIRPCHERQCAKTVTRCAAGVTENGYKFPNRQTGLAAWVIGSAMRTREPISGGGTVSLGNNARPPTGPAGPGQGQPGQGRVSRASGRVSRRHGQGQPGLRQGQPGHGRASRPRHRPAGPRHRPAGPRHDQPGHGTDQPGHGTDQPATAQTSRATAQTSRATAETSRRQCRAPRAHRARSWETRPRAAQAARAATS